MAGLHYGIFGEPYAMQSIGMALTAAVACNVLGNAIDSVVASIQGAVPVDEARVEAFVDAAQGDLRSDNDQTRAAALESLAQIRVSGTVTSSISGKPSIRRGIAQGLLSQATSEQRAAARAARHLLGPEASYQTVGHFAEDDDVIAALAAAIGSDDADLAEDAGEALRRIASNSSSARAFERASVASSGAVSPKFSVIVALQRQLVATRGREAVADAAAGALAAALENQSMARTLVEEGDGEKLDAGAASGSGAPSSGGPSRMACDLLGQIARALDTAGRMQEWGARQSLCLAVTRLARMASSEGAAEGMLREQGAAVRVLVDACGAWSTTERGTLDEGSFESDAAALCSSEAADAVWQLCFHGRNYAREQFAEAGAVAALVSALPCAGAGTSAASCLGALLQFPTDAKARYLGVTSAIEDRNHVEALASLMGRRARLSPQRAALDWRALAQLRDRQRAGDHRGAGVTSVVSGALSVARFVAQASDAVEQASDEHFATICGGLQAMLRHEVQWIRSENEDRIDDSGGASARDRAGDGEQPTATAGEGLVSAQAMYMLAGPRLAEHLLSDSGSVVVSDLHALLLHGVRTNAAPSEPAQALRCILCDESCRARVAGMSDGAADLLCGEDGLIQMMAQKGEQGLPGSLRRPIARGVAGACHDGRLASAVGADPGAVRALVACCTDTAEDREEDVVKAASHALVLVATAPGGDAVRQEHAAVVQAAAARCEELNLGKFVDAVSRLMGQ